RRAEEFRRVPPDLDARRQVRPARRRRPGAGDAGQTGGPFDPAVEPPPADEVTEFDALFVASCRVGRVFETHREPAYSRWVSKTRPTLQDTSLDPSARPSPTLLAHPRAAPAIGSDFADRNDFQNCTGCADKGKGPVRSGPGDRRFSPDLGRSGMVGKWFGAVVGLVTSAGVAPLPPPPPPPPL